uniref:DUF630 domain-containing protein n=1 Tax=Nymphaea colorata TaxID=210225 RepID=A0A5K0YIW1_9MAGN|nr:unnamed protein product [Nymphaea colorata]
MGCATSKVESVDTVDRCRERRRLMKQAMKSRHHVASAHADYLRLFATSASRSRLSPIFRPASPSPSATVLSL